MQNMYVQKNNFVTFYMTNFIFIFIRYLYISLFIYENLCLLPVKILYNLFSYIYI